MQESIQQTIDANPQWVTGQEGTGLSALGAGQEGQGQSPSPSPNPAPSAQDPAPATFTDLDPSTLDPSALDVYKRMQAAFTQKTQKLAEERRANEALQQQYAEWQAQAAARQEAPDPAYDPAGYDREVGYETADPVVSQLVQRLNQMEQRLQQEGQSRQLQQVQSSLTQLEGKLGRALSEAEIGRTGPLMRQNPGLSVEQAYYLAHREEHETRLKHQAAEETLKTLSQARGAPQPPSALAGRGGIAPAPTSARGFVLDALDQAGIR